MSARKLVMFVQIGALPWCGFWLGRNISSGDTLGIAFWSVMLLGFAVGFALNLTDRGAA